MNVKKLHMSLKISNFMIIIKIKPFITIGIVNIAVNTRFIKKLDRRKL